MSDDFVPFKIFPNLGYLNSEFQIIIFDKNINQIEISIEDRIYKEINVNSNSCITLREFNNAGKYKASCKINEIEFELEFEIQNSIRIGDSVLKKCYAFEDMPYSIYLMKDRMYIYNELDKNIYNENNISPDEIIQVNKDYLLFKTKFSKSGEEITNYAIYSLKSFKIIWELVGNYKEINLITNQNVLWIDEFEEKKIYAFELNKIINNIPLCLLNTDYEKYYFNDKNKEFYIEKPDEIKILDVLSNQLKEVLKTDNTALDYHGNYYLYLNNIITIYKSESNYLNKIEIKEIIRPKFEDIDFFFSGLTFQINEDSNIDALIKKFTPINNYTESKYRHNLEISDHVKIEDYIHQFFPIGEIGFFIIKNKNKTLKGINYTKLNGIWIGTPEYYSNEKQNLFLYSPAEPNKLLKSDNNLKLKYYTNKGIVIDYLTHFVFYGSNRTQTQINVQIKKYLHSKEKDYLITSTSSNSYTEEYNVLDLDNILNKDNKPEFFLTKINILNYDELEHAKYFWFTKLNEENIYSLKGFEIISGNNVDITNDKLKYFKTKKIADFKFFKKYFMIDGDSYFNIDNLEMRDGIIGDISNVTSTLNKIISRRGDKVYLNLYNKGSLKYDLHEIILNSKFILESYLAPNGNYLILQEEYGKYLFYDLQTETTTEFFSGKFVAFTNEGNVIYNENKTRNTVIIDPLTLKIITPSNYHYYRFISPDGNLFAPLSAIFKYYDNIKNNFVQKEDLIELNNLLNYPDKITEEESNIISENRVKYFNENIDYFKKENIKSPKEIQVNSIIKQKKFIEIGVVGCEAKGLLELPPDLTFLNYVAFSYNSNYIACVGATSSKGFITFCKYNFDKFKNILIIEDVITTRFQNAIWVCGFSRNNWLAFYDSAPYTYMLKSNDNLILNQIDYTKLENRHNFLCFSNTGNLMALSEQGYNALSRNGSGHQPSTNLHILETDTRKILMSFNEHGDEIKGTKTSNLSFVAFSKDEKRIMSLSKDGVVIVRNINFNHEETAK